MSGDLTFVFEGEPAPGEIREAAPGVFWLRMPLPFKLDHINLWLLEDGDGWTIIDTGINRDEVKAAWEQVFADHFTDRPLKRVIVTHFHPDHIGLAGWLTERFDVELWTSAAEWTFARMLSIDTGEDLMDCFRRFYRLAGFDDDLMALVEKRANPYPTRVSPIPTAFRRISDGDEIDINGRTWRIMVGTGHAPEHCCLYCEDLNVLISGDQILPIITPNISIWPQEPDADPLKLYLGSLPRFKPLPDDVLVLPSHKWPFTGLHGRLDVLAHHHDERLEETFAACAEPLTGVEVLKHLFKRELDDHQVFFAIGESLAHLHYLMGQGRIEKIQGKDSTPDRYRQVAA
ncbi:MAG: MBL fold metallo-hydrolase [Rhodospirillales bacterium]|nr:MBL fold metallo-hydrolase [Rhodospirillales bacterium]